MTVRELDATRVSRAKQAFSTRRASPDCMRTLIDGNLKPASGDLVLATVDEIGKQTKLELTDGRRAFMFPGDEIVVSFGNRYAPDQYEAIIGPDLSPCDLVAAGGVVGVELSRHDRMLPPTKITPIGLIGDAEGKRLNLMQFRVAAGVQVPRIPAVLSLGTSMNAGKTLTSTSMVRGLKRFGLKVAALKITGTGAGGDMWIVRDAGADVSLDFTDAGFSTTYLTPVPDIERATYLLMNHAASLGCQIAMIEIADGLQQLETAQLVRSDAISRIAIGTVFAAYDAMGAKYGVDLLREAGHAVLAMSGRLGRSPLGVREAELATGLKVYTPFELQEGALVPAIREVAAERHANVFRDHGAGRDIRVDRSREAAGPADIRHPVAEAGNGRVIALQTSTRPGAYHGVPDATKDGERFVLSRVANSVMQAEVSRLCGAPFGKRMEGRCDRRNGIRGRVWESAIGPVPVRIPRLRRGRYHPTFLTHPGGKLGDALGVLIGVASRGGDDAAVVKALSKLVAEIGGPVLDEGEIAELAAETHDLLDDLAALRTLGVVVGARRKEGFADGTGSWIAIAERADDEASPDVGGLDVPDGAARQMARISREDEEQSAGALFQASHAIAGE